MNENINGYLIYPLINPFQSGFEDGYKCGYNSRNEEVEEYKKQISNLKNINEASEIIIKSLEFILKSEGKTENQL